MGSFLALHLSELEHEVFVVLFLNNQNQPIEIEEMFKSTIDSASIYPREVVKRALHYNAAAVVIAHNHPSGICKPSDSDITVTEKLKSALNLIDIRILDHFIIGDGVPYPFAEHGLIEPIIN